MSSIGMMSGLMLFLLAIPLLIGFYVYRDAKRRDMNAALWTLVALLAPSLIGFIIYLLVRGSYSDLRCPRCDTRVKEQYVVCPGCGARLRPSCRSCGAAVEPEWKVCPQCAHPLDDRQDDVVMPVRPKDRALWKILAAVLLIPVLLIALLFLFSAAGPGGSGVGVAAMPVDDYLSEKDDDPRITAWLEAAGERYDTAYVLRYRTEREAEQRTQYLIWLPCMAEEDEMKIGNATNGFGGTVKLYIDGTASGGGNTVILVTCTGDASPDLKIWYGGERVKLEITDVDYSLGFSDHVSY